VADEGLIRPSGFARVDVLMPLCDRLETALATADTTRARLLEALLLEALEPAEDVPEAAG
jgi:type I restriction enzyme S subunit